MRLGLVSGSYTTNNEMDAHLGGMCVLTGGVYTRVVYTTRAVYYTYPLSSWSNYLGIPQVPMQKYGTFSPRSPAQLTMYDTVAEEITLYTFTYDSPEEVQSETESVLGSYVPTCQGLMLEYGLIGRFLRHMYVKYIRYGICPLFLGKLKLPRRGQRWYLTMIQVCGVGWCRIFCPIPTQSICVDPCHNSQVSAAPEYQCLGSPLALNNIISFTTTYRACSLYKPYIKAKKKSQIYHTILQCLFILFDSTFAIYTDCEEGAG